MSRMARVAALPRQLAVAVARNGLGNVWRFGARLSARHGVLGALRYAIAPRELRRQRLAQMEGGGSLRGSAPASVTSADFDDDWSVPTAVWKGRLSATSPPASTAGAAEAVHVCFGAATPPAEVSDDDWIVRLRPGDRPEPHLAHSIACAGADPCLQVLTFDMSFAGDAGRPRPVLQPGVNPWLARNADVGFGRYAFRAGILKERSGDAYAQLRCWLDARSLNAARDRWGHVFVPLVEAALSDEDVVRARAEAVDRGRLGLAEARGAERISVVICTHNRGRLVRQLVRALDDPRIAEVVIVANNTTSPPALQTLDWARRRQRCRVLVRDEPFNFSRLSNAGAGLTTGERLLFLNDDVAPISDDWLDALLQPLRDPDVGVCGALLLYPDETVQHAGMFLGFKGHAGHSLRHARLPEQDYLFYGSVPREVSAVTGAVMMVKRDLFTALNGFDEGLPTYLQDVDLCLRSRALGLATVWTPFAELLHMESTSIKEIDDSAFHRQRTIERARFLERWGALVASDPLRNPAFNVDDESQRSLSQV